MNLLTLPLLIIANHIEAIRLTICSNLPIILHNKDATEYKFSTFCQNEMIICCKLIQKHRNTFFCRNRSQGI